MEVSGADGSPDRFVGRRAALALLDAEMATVVASGRGRLLAVRGRRQVGKSRLLTEWLRGRREPAVFSTASRQPPGREVALFAEELAAGVPGGDLLADARPQDWDDALRLLAGALSDAGPTVVVLDEFPYLAQGDPGVEGALQKWWDRVLSDRPLLLVLVGSDLAMMERLSSYDQPLYGRVDREVVVEPLEVAEVAALLRLAPADAFDAALVVGGFPRVVRSWTRGGLRAYVGSSFEDPTSALVVTGERMLAAELPAAAQARTVLTAIGRGATRFTELGRESGLPQTTLQRALEVLAEKRVVAVDEPVSARPAPRLRRYRVADPYLRFWLRFVEPSLPELERGRPDLALARFDRGWGSWRGSAVEPLVRHAIARLPLGERLRTAHVGAYWTRSADIEVDLVGASDSRPPAVVFVGSVKWRDREPFGARDLAALAAARARVPGTTPETALVGVSRSGSATTDLDIALTPADLLAATG